MLNQVVANSSYPFSRMRDLSFYSKNLENVSFGELASNQFVPYNKKETEIWNEKGFGYWDIYLNDIDWKPFWFFNNEAHKFGGVFEWSYTKFDKDTLLYTWHEEESSKCKTKEEMLSNAILRKQKQIENLKEKYSNKEYKKLRAKEIAKNRKEKMGN